MEWYSKIYLGKNVKEKYRRIKWKVEHGAGVPGYFFITLAANGVDNLDMIESVFLKSKKVRARLPMVVGIASTYSEAVQLISKIARDVHKTTGNWEIRKYFEEER